VSCSAGAGLPDSVLVRLPVLAGLCGGVGERIGRGGRGDGGRSDWGQGPGGGCRVL